MKNTILFFFLTIVNICISQTWTSGVVQFEPNFSVQFDIDQQTDLVTMTMIFPQSGWFGVGPGIMRGMGMGKLNDDAIVYNANGLEDRNMQEGTGLPPLDASQDWSVSSDTTSGGLRTLVATRAINTGDPEDFVFPTSASAFPIIYAKGGILNFGYHGTGQYGGTVVNVTLSTSEFENALNDILIAPNPASSKLNIKIPNSLINRELTIETFNVLGHKIVSETISDGFEYSVNVSQWNSGLYLVKLTSQAGSITKRFIKL